VRIDIFTLFPEMLASPFSVGIFKRAIERNIISIKAHNIRDCAHDAHHTVDDYAYGGGAGMILKPEPVFEAVESLKAVIGAGGDDKDAGRTPVILLTPQGRLFTQQIARELAGYENIILICGRYEGIDERVRQYLATDELSIGDYVLSGGDLAAMVVIDSVVRLLPGVLGSEVSLEEDSHTLGLLEYQQYTRPAEYRGWAVPEVLLSGNHAEIARWRREQSLWRTLKRRPDLLEKASLSPAEKRLVAGWKQNCN